MSIHDSQLKTPPISQAVEILAGVSTEGTVDPRVSKLIMGFEDNAGVCWRKRFHPLSNFIGVDTRSYNFEDDESNDLNELHVMMVDNDLTSVHTVNADAHLGYQLDLGKNKKRTFKLKGGVNFFGLIFNSAITSVVSDSVTITVDGVPIDDVSLGIVNEIGLPVSTTFSTVIPVSELDQTGVWFYGFDTNKEQVIVVENTDSTTQVFRWCGVEVGYLTNPSEMSIALTDLRIASGSASIRGQDVKVPEVTPTFAASLGYGKSSLVSANVYGDTQVYEGAEGWFSITKPEVTVSSLNTTLPVKNCYLAPSKGLFIMQMPHGQKITGSYTGKDETDIHNHFLTGVIYDSDFVDYTPLDTFGGAVGTFNSAVSVYLVANGNENAIEIDSSNNKLDFSIAVDGGALAPFVATIPDGLYSADVMKLGNVIAQAMQAAKPLERNSYFCNYSPKNHLWYIGIRGVGEVDSFELNFGFGSPNFANSIHSDLGYLDAELNGAFSFAATTEKESLAWRCFERGEFRNANFPTDIQSGVPAYVVNTDSTSIQDRGHAMQAQNSSEGLVYKIYTTPDCCGVDLSFMMYAAGSVISIELDKREKIFLMQTDSPTSSAGDLKAVVMNAAITFPIGTHELSIRVETDTATELGANTNETRFLGHRVHYPRPPLERLKRNEAGLKAYIIRPIKMMAEFYQQDCVVGVGDKLDADPLFGGIWAGTVTGAAFPNEYRNTTTQFSYADFTFTIEGVGGISVSSHSTTVSSRQVAMYLTSGPTGTDNAANLIDQTIQQYASVSQEANPLGIMGLPAGQYTVRFKHMQVGQNFLVSGAWVYDTVKSTQSVDAYQNFQLATAKRTTAYPAIGWGAEIIPITQDNKGWTPLYHGRSRYNDGKAETDYGYPTPVFTHDFSSTPVHRDSLIFGYNINSSGLAGQYIGYFGLAETMYVIHCALSTNSGNLDTEFDGRLIGVYGSTNLCSSGTPWSAAHFLSFPMTVMDFYRAGTGDMSNSTTFILDNTIAIREGMKIIITADGQPDEIRRVDTVTADTSFTINKGISAFANYTTANNVTVRFPGFHRMKVIENVNQVLRSNCVGRLPLPIRPFEFKQYEDKEGEVATISYYAIAGYDIPLPIYKDGTPASWDECIVQMLTESATSFISYNTGFRDVGTSTIRGKITAIRKRP